MKRKTVFALALLLLCTAVITAAANTPEKRTLRLFNRYRETLESEIAACLETGQIGSELPLTFNYWDGEHPVVEYIAAGQGLAPSSRYYGFFYSFDGTPVSFQNAGAPLTETSEETWTWRGEGDNRGLVRRLDGKWFYFEAEL